MGTLILVKNWDLDTCFLQYEFTWWPGRQLWVQLCLSEGSPGCSRLSSKVQPQLCRSWERSWIFPILCSVQDFLWHSSMLQQLPLLYPSLGNIWNALLYVRNFLELLCSCMAWERLFFLAELLLSWLLVFNLSLSKSESEGSCEIFCLLDQCL